MRIKEQPAVTATVKRTFEVTDGPVIDHPWSRTGKQVRVEFVTVTYDWNPDDQSWSASSVLNVELRGVVLKKDGTPGKERYASSPAFEWKESDDYRWLRDLVADATPEHRLPRLPTVPEEYR